jgi:CHAD domain-containing protein
VEELTAFLERIQHQEHDLLVTALDSDRYRRLVSDWQTFLEQPSSSDAQAPAAGRLLAPVVSRRAWRLSKRIAAAAERADAQTDAVFLHEVRIACKKLRYLIDVTPSFYEAADLECVLAALKTLQRVLGDFNDAQVQEKRLLECGGAIVAGSGPARALLAVGRLAEQSRQRRERLREQIADGLSRFLARQTRSACRRAFKHGYTSERAR